MLRIDLPGDVREALGRLASHEFRDPPAQATVVIREHLRELGLLEADVRSTKQARRVPRQRDGVAGQA